MSLLLCNYLTFTLIDVRVESQNGRKSLNRELIRKGSAFISLPVKSEKVKTLIKSVNNCWVDKYSLQEVVWMLVVIDQEQEERFFAEPSVLSGVLEFSYNDFWTEFACRVLLHPVFELFAILHPLHPTGHLWPGFWYQRAYSLRDCRNTCRNRSTEKQVV